MTFAIYTTITVASRLLLLIFSHFALQRISFRTTCVFLALASASTSFMWLLGLENMALHIL